MTNPTSIGFLGLGHMGRKTLMPYATEGGETSALPTTRKRRECTDGGVNRAGISPLIVEAARGGLGLAWVPRDIVEGHIASRSTISVLDEWAATYPGYHLYYASRRASSAPALVVDVLRLSNSG